MGAAQWRGRWVQLCGVTGSKLSGACELKRSDLERILEALAMVCYENAYVSEKMIDTESVKGYQETAAKIRSVVDRLGGLEKVNDK